LVLRFKWLSSLNITIVEEKEKRGSSEKGTNSETQNAVAEGKWCPHVPAGGRGV